MQSLFCEADDGSAQPDGSQDSSEERDSDIGDEGEEEQELEDEEEEASERAAKTWKENMLKNAAKKFSSMKSASKALENFIYEKDENGKYRGAVNDGDATGDGEGEDSDDDGDEAFFRPRRKRTLENGSGEILTLSDSVLEHVARRLQTNLMAWISSETLCARLKRIRWGTGQRSDNGSGKGNTDDDGEVDGDFEDLETGEVHKSNIGDKGDDNGAKDEGDGSDMEAIKA